MNRPLNTPASQDHLPDYAELHCLSNFSFLRGASHAEELIQRALGLGYQALAITDECSFAGIVRAYAAALGQPIQLIVGTELCLSDDLRLVVLVKNRAGYAALSQLITSGRRRAGKGHYRLERADLLSLHDCCLLWLPGWRPDVEQGQWLVRHFPDCSWIAVERLLETGELMTVGQWQALAQQLGLPLVASGDVHMHQRSRRALQDTLTAIRLRLPLNECGESLFQNGERHLRPRARLARLYPHAWLAESIRIAQQCRFSLSELQYEYPQEIVPPGQTPAAYLRYLTETGAHQRYGAHIPDSVHKQIEHELNLIRELDYERYFLTVYDIVKFAREQNILCQGRGSAANSAVCYCLGITEVNPVESNLLFERFISRERNEPPDIDVDFEHERREEVIQYIYAKYGRERAGLAATVITYRSRSAVRDVGAALGWETAELERLLPALSTRFADPQKPLSLEQRLQQQGFDASQKSLRQLLKLVRQIKGFPRHLSQHVGGFVIAARALSELVPVENAAMEGRSIIQWDKNDIETLKLLKVDVLALGMLTAIRKTLDLVSNWRGTPLTMADIPRADAKTFAMIQRADTVGVFQIESRAQMAMLPRLKPATFYDLVVEVAIVRPGPIQGNMVKPYLNRREGKEAISYPNPAIKSVLERTYGVSIFQEQAMQIAIIAAGFSPGEADELRRAMGRFRNDGDLIPFREKLIGGMRARGYDDEFCLRIYEQLKGFGSYGFPESHAASFALLAYISAWLKCHEPASFVCALINSQPMGFYSTYQLIQDARRHDVSVHAIDIRYSQWHCSLEPCKKAHPAVRLGLRLISGFSEDAARRIQSARTQYAFKSYADLAARAQLSSAELKLLAHANALVGFGDHRHRSYWHCDGLEFKDDLLGIHSVNEATPLLRAPNEWQNLCADMHSFQASLGTHPMALLRPKLAHWRLQTAMAANECSHQTTITIAGLVTNRQQPGTANGVTFLTLEDESGQVNVVVWASVMARHQRAISTGHLLIIQGIVQRTDAVVHILVRSVSDLSLWLNGLNVQSRDFH